MEQHHLQDIIVQLELVNYLIRRGSTDKFN